MNFIQDTELIKDAKALGFNEKPYWQSTGELENLNLSAHYGYTIQQLEEWLWKEYKIRIEASRILGFSPTILTKYVSVFELPPNDSGSWYKSIFGKNKFDDPFDARLEGIKKAIDYLSMEKAIQYLKENKK